MPLDCMWQADVFGLPTLYLKNWNCFPTFISQNISYKMLLILKDLEGLATTKPCASLQQLASSSQSNYHASNNPGSFENYQRLRLTPTHSRESLGTTVKSSSRELQLSATRTDTPGPRVKLAYSLCLITVASCALLLFNLSPF